MLQVNIKILCSYQYIQEEKGLLLVAILVVLRVVAKSGICRGLRRCKVAVRMKDKEATSSEANSLTLRRSSRKIETKGIASSLNEQEKQKQGKGPTKQVPTEESGNICSLSTNDLPTVRLTYSFRR